MTTSGQTVPYVLKRWEYLYLQHKKGVTTYKLLCLFTSVVMNQKMKIPSQVCGGQYELWCYCLATLQQSAGILARASGLVIYMSDNCCGFVAHVLDDCLCCLDLRFQLEMLILLFAHMLPSSVSGKSMVLPLKVLILLHPLSR